MPSAILVEDNETLRHELAHYLSEEGFAMRGLDCDNDFNEALTIQSANILILDLTLPEEDGISITKRIRRMMPDLGIILLTARARSSDRMEGCAAGADIYLTKPTRPQELATVIRNLFGRRAGAAIGQLSRCSSGIWRRTLTRHDGTGLARQSDTGRSACIRSGIVNRTRTTARNERTQSEYCF